MKQKWFIFWYTYDSPNVDEFDNQQDAEKLVAKILANQENKHNGTQLIAVIFGVKKEHQIVQCVSEVKFVK